MQLQVRPEHMSRLAKIFSDSDQEEAKEEAGAVGFSKGVVVPEAAKHP